MSAVERMDGEKKGSTRFTVKEKVLLQMGEFAIEEDLGEYPFELTQKGLSVCLGTRRSHIAASMKGLLEDKFIELRKGHIEGEDRRQNAYLLTPKGWERANELRNSILHEEVEIEREGEVKKLPIEEVLKTTKLTLLSVVNQLEHGKPLSDETTLVTKPGPQMIPVYCPTCMQSYEVENIYGHEEVGFDCPGCGRPYRIVPAQKDLSEGEPSSEIPAGDNQLRPMLLFFVFASIMVELFIFVLSSYRTALFLAIFITIPLIIFAGISGSRKKQRRARKRWAAASGVIVTMALLGFVLVLLWNFLIIHIDFERELVVFMILSAALALGYAGIPREPVNLRGEYMLTAGLVMLLIAIALPFLRDIEGLTMASVPFLGIVGTSAIVLSSFNYVEREDQLLDSVLAGGVIIVFVSVVELFPDRADALDDIVLASIVLLGLFMISLRFIQMRTSVSVGGHFAASAGLVSGFIFVALGVFMIWGDSPLAGLAEIALISPFIYYSIRKVFSSEWMYRVPIAAFLAFVGALVLVNTFLT